MVRSGDKALRELPSPGKSGSVFFISHDERFFIKTMRKGGVLVVTVLRETPTPDVLPPQRCPRYNCDGAKHVSDPKLL